MCFAWSIEEIFTLDDTVALVHRTGWHSPKSHCRKRRGGVVAIWQCAASAKITSHKICIEVFSNVNTHKSHNQILTNSSVYCCFVRPPRDTGIRRANIDRYRLFNLLLWKFNPKTRELLLPRFPKCRSQLSRRVYKLVTWPLRLSITGTNTLSICFR